MMERKYPGPLTLAILCALLAGPGRASAGELFEASGVSGGLVVHVGCGDGRLTAQLGAGDGCLVQGLDTDAANVNRARRHIRSLGVYGKVTAEGFDGKRLPYTDNLVNLLVVSDPFDVPREEMLRVLAPRGVAMVGGGRGQGTGDRGKVEIGGRVWRKMVKPWPADIDEWTHYLHSPGNNAVARDTVVGPPRHMQWLGAPEWARNHHKLCSISSVVTARGRLFAIVDEATSANIHVPGKWSIVARDAFSGVTLWKKPIESWAWHGIRFRSGPPQLTRLLVASGDRLYAPLSLSGPISAIDAVSGETLKTFDGTEGAEEIILAEGVLLVLQGAPVAEHAFLHAAFQDRYRLPNQKTLMAADAQSGQTLWRWSEPDVRPRPETLGSDGRRVYLQVGEGVACLDLKSGEKLWHYRRKIEEVQKSQDEGTQKKKRAAPAVTYGTNTLVVAGGVVLCNLADHLTALRAEDGRELWQRPAGGGFHAPGDLFVIDGLVWPGHCVGDSVSPPPVRHFSEGLDLYTGAVKATNAVMVDLQTSGHHHRCYREKATDRFIITGKRGIELMDLVGHDHSRNNWVRGACQYGILPANGLMYAPSHACGCYMESKLRGFWALAAERVEGRGSRVEGQESRVEGPGGRDGRLVRGPAYAPDSIRHSSFVIHPSDWSTYRQNPLRSGVAATVVPVDLNETWRAKIGGRLTQPVVAEGKVLLASVDENTVYALDADSGAVLWTHVAGGRVDSPPTIHQGTALFGSADGRVTCLRLADGELVWRFLAAPDDLRAVAYDRVESVWPVHGSVLVLGGVAYCSAGRSTWIDGGIDLYGLDPATGKVLHHAHFESKHPEFQEGKDQARPEHETRVDQNTTDYKTFLASDRSDSFSMAGGAISDVLTSDGRNVFLRQVKFNAALEKQDQMTRHLFSTSSLLDDNENHRSHWVLGTGDFSRIPVAYSWIVDRPGTRMPTIAVPTGVMMVFDDRAVWGVQTQGDATGKYYLFKAENRPFSEDEEPLPDFRRIPAEEANPSLWQHDFPVRATALVKSGDHLVLGVMPVEIPPDDPHAAYEGRLGGSIWVCKETDGSKIAQYPLDAPVVWDGMAAAGEKLFLATADGSVRCFAGPR